VKLSWRFLGREIWALELERPERDDDEDESYLAVNGAECEFADDVPFGFANPGPMHEEDPGVSCLQPPHPPGS
jgi:hypothetical protein